MKINVTICLKYTDIHKRKWITIRDGLMFKIITISTLIKVKLMQSSKYLKFYRFNIDQYSKTH